VITTVDCDVEIASCGTANRERSCTSLGWVKGRLEGSAWNQDRQRCERAAVYRQTLELSLTNDAADIGLSCFDQGRAFRSNCNLFTGTGRFHLWFNNDSLKNVNRHGIYNDLGEALCLDLQAIIAWHQLSYFIRTGAARSSLAFDARGLVNGFYDCVRY